MQFGTTAEDDRVPEDFRDDAPLGDDEAQGPLHAEEEDIDEWEDGGSEDAAADELEIGAPELTDTDEEIGRAHV